MVLKMVRDKGHDVIVVSQVCRTKLHKIARFVRRLMSRVAYFIFFYRNIKRTIIFSHTTLPANSMNKYVKVRVRRADIYFNPVKWARTKSI